MQRRSPTLMENQQEIATPDVMNKKNRSVRSQKLKFGTTKWLTYTAMFAALAIAMKLIGQYLTITPNFKITLIYVIWIISGAVLGIIGGATVCFVSDVLGAILVPMGAMNPYLIVGNVFYGVLAALVFRFTPIKNYVVKLIASGIACTVLCTCLINSLALYYTYGYYETLSFWQYFLGFRALQPVISIINIIVVVAMIPLLLRLKLLPRLKNKTQKSEELLCQTSR